MLAGRNRRNIMRKQRAAEREGGGGGGGDASYGFSREMPNVSSDENKPQRRRSSHLLDAHKKEKYLEYEYALDSELTRIEATDSNWTHPMGFHLFAAMRILNAPLDPVLKATGDWIQPEDVDDIPSMFDSYLNVNCLYYSLVGVLAIENSLYSPNASPDAPEWLQWLNAVSRFCWAANGVWSFAAVIASFHILWCVYVTPRWAKRRFILDNSKTISLVYALGAPNFAMMLIGTITGVMANVFNQGEYSQRDWVSAAAGLGLGCTVVFVFVLASGSLISKVVRPWKLADQNLITNKGSSLWKRNSFSREGARDSFRTLESSRAIFTRGSSKEPKDDSFHDNDKGPAKDEPDAGFGPLNMPNAADKLCRAGLTMNMLLKVNNDVLMDQLLQGAGVERAGDRLRIILFLRDKYMRDGDGDSA